MASTIDKVKDFMQRQSYVNNVVDATGWSKSQAKDSIKHAEELGMPDYRYIDNQCWNLSDAEIIALNEKIIEEERIKAEREALIASACDISGLSIGEITKKLEKAEELQISHKQFIKKYMWELNFQEMEEFSKALSDLKENRKKNNRFYIDVVCEKTGWERQKVREEMKKSRQLGISNLKYVQKALWNKTDAEIKELAEFLVDDKIRIKDNKSKYIAQVREETGWSTGKAELEVAKTKANCGASYEDFIVFRLFEKAPEEQRKFVTLAMFNNMRLKYNNHDESSSEFDDKAKFNKNFADLIVHKWFVNENLSYDEFFKKIQGLKKLIIKPLSATQGKGIEVVNCNVSDEDNQRVYNYIVSLEPSIIEEYIIQHQEMNGFCSSTVNTVRVMTINFNGECKFLYSVFRMGKDGVVDNFHAGGVAAAVDLDTGVVCTNAVDLNGKVFTHAPATGRQIKGFQIPHWDKIIEICKKASVRFEGTRLVGWDFAITQDGVELIEGNPGGSYVVAQMPYVEDGVGLYDIMVGPYLPEFYN